jgi:hypothetical protein
MGRTSSGIDAALLRKSRRKDAVRADGPSYLFERRRRPAGAARAEPFELAQGRDPECVGFRGTNVRSQGPPLPARVDSTAMITST